MPRHVHVFVRGKTRQLFSSVGASDDRIFKATVGLSLHLCHPTNNVTQQVLLLTQNTFLPHDYNNKWEYFCCHSLALSCTSLNTSSPGTNSFKHLKQGPQLFMSPSCLWPWPGLLRHPGAECVWMDTFPGCSLIDASVDARGLMHSSSLLTFPANPACRLLPLSHGGFAEMSLSRAKKVQRVSSPRSPAKRKDYVRQGVRSEGKLG